MDKNILIIGASPNQLTGYGVVVKYLAEGLITRGHNVKVLGLGTSGIPYNDYELPLISQSNLLDFYIDKYKITQLITVCDIQLQQFARIPEIVERKNLKWIHHVTVSNNGVDSMVLNRIENAAELVAPSKFVFDRLAEKGYASTVIPHAFTLHLSNEENKHSGFNFLLVANNQIQKNIPVVLKAFKIVNNKYPETRLLCVVNPVQHGGLNLLQLVKKLELNNIIFMNGRFGYMLTRGEMSVVYQTADVHVSASMGESFCLPLLEASYFGLPSIVPDFSATGDFIKEFNCGICIEPKLMQTNFSLAEQALIDEDDLAREMIHVYEDKKWFAELKSETVNVIESDKFKLENVLNLWEQIINKTEVN